MKLWQVMVLQLATGLAWGDSPKSESVISVPVPEAGPMFELKPIIDAIGPYDHLRICKLGKSVSRLKQIGGTGDTKAYKLVPPDDTSSAFEVSRDDWWGVVDSVSLPGAQAKAHLEQLSALRQTEDVGGWGCYVPSYAYQFMRGDKVVFEISVSWGCEAVMFKVDGSFSSAVCDTSSPAAKKLLELTEANLKRIPKKR